MRSRNKISNLVAIVVPLSNREELSPDEVISLRHLLHFLGHYDKFLIASRDLNIEIAGFKIKRFDNEFFGSIVAHTKLMLSSEFYRTFQAYKYILIYHLDALVFSDQLVEWCMMDLDYIGAPWISHPAAPYAEDHRFEGKVGNGGFSLRKVKSFLNVINSSRCYIHPDEYWNKYYTSKNAVEKILNYPKKILKHFGIRNNVKTELDRYAGLKNEDYFWCNRARHYYPEFKVASVETALRFAFECVPRYCYELNHHELPFGCHAWPKYDRAFWEPYLLK